MTKKIGLGVGLASFAFLSSPAWAIPTLTPGDLTQMTNDAVSSLIKTVAVGGDHRDYMPATPQGVTGIDIGLELTAIKVPQEFIDAMTLATQQPVTDIPTVFPLPKLNIHKGLPAGIDLGFSFSTYESLFKTIGAMVSYAPLKGGKALPSLAFRASGTYTHLYFMDTHTYRLDAVVSKDLIVTDPYIGAGVQFWSGDLSVQQGVSGGLSVDVSGHQSSTNPHIFAGIPLKLLILKITGEIDYSFAKVTTYGAKVGFSF